MVLFFVVLMVRQVFSVFVVLLWLLVLCVRVVCFRNFLVILFGVCLLFVEILVIDNRFLIMVWVVFGLVFFRVDRKLSWMLWLLLVVVLVFVICLMVVFSLLVFLKSLCSWCCQIVGKLRLERIVENRVLLLMWIVMLFWLKVFSVVMDSVSRFVLVVVILFCLRFFVLICMILLRLFGCWWNMGL